MRRGLLWLLVFLVPLAGKSQDPWQQVLSRMRLDTGVTRLTRTNCVQVMLAAFQSNDVVKALIFMPGATDEFYLFRRARAEIPGRFPTLLDAVIALTNQTRIQATFAPPFLLLHTENDPLSPQVKVGHEPTARKLATHGFLPHVEFNDSGWDLIQPLLKGHLAIDIRPWRYSPEAYHFYRSAFAAWNLSGWEAIEAVALASQTRAIVEGRSIAALRGPVIRFENDMRTGPSGGSNSAKKSQF
jgi:hypothetical protein